MNEELDYPCFVNEVHDGDTVKVSLVGFDMSRTFWIRVRDWDAPESHEPEGKRITKIAREVLPPYSRVTVRCPVEPDTSFDRYVADLILLSGERFLDVVRSRAETE